MVQLRILLNDIAWFQMLLTYVKYHVKHPKKQNKTQNRSKSNLVSCGSSKWGQIITLEWYILHNIWEPLLKINKANQSTNYLDKTIVLQYFFLFFICFYIFLYFYKSRLKLSAQRKKKMVCLWEAIEDSEGKTTVEFIPQVL